MCEAVKENETLMNRFEATDCCKQPCNHHNELTFNLQSAKHYCHKQAHEQLQLLTCVQERRCILYWANNLCKLAGISAVLLLLMMYRHA